MKSSRIGIKIMHCMKNKSLRILKKLKIEKSVGNKFEDIRGIIRIRNSKNIQYNGQKG
jgi:hypothetical protein